MFTKYQKTTETTKVLLMYLLLNGYKLAHIDHLEESIESRNYGLSIKKLYGVTNDFVDIVRMEREIDEIQNPIICSPKSYEYYANAETIFSYTPSIESAPLCINDLNIISKVMMIAENKVVSSSYAYPIEDSRCRDKGFMYFYDYVTKSTCEVGKWHIIYQNKELTISYKSHNEDKVEEIPMYSASGIDKTSTFKMIIYIIRKACLTVDEWLPDNFDIQSFEMVVNHNE